VDIAPKIETLLQGAQTLLNAYSKNAPPADADTKMNTLLSRVRVLMALYPDHPRLADLKDRVRDLVEARGGNDL
jgi:hypothetical protein